MSRWRIVTVAGDAEREAQVATTAGNHPEVDLVLRCLDRVEILAAIRGGSLDAILVVGDPPWFDAQCAEEARRAHIRLLAYCGDASTRERFAGWGASTLDIQAGFDDVLAELQMPAGEFPVAATDTLGPSGKLVCVWGPKGAPGRSSIARELGVELARAEPRTLLVDADMYGGDLVQFFGITEELPSIVWACRMAAKKELDGATLAYELRRTGEGGPVFLPGIPRSELWPEVSDFGWKEFIDRARASFSFTVCDMGFSLEPAAGAFPDAGEGRNRVTRAALSDADSIVAVIRADPVGIKTFVWAYHELTQIVEDDRIVMIANRVTPGEENDVSAVVHRYLGRKPLAFIPEHTALFGDAIAFAKPVVDLRGGVATRTAIRTLASALGAASPQRGFLARLGGRARD